MPASPISEGAVRSAFERHARITRSSTEPTTRRRAKADRAASGSASGRRPLRRWSVAELIARAAAAPPSGPATA